MISDKTKGKAGLSRRSFMKWTGALGASAAVYGCSGGSGGDDGYVTPQDTLVFDSTVQEFNSSHSAHCISNCNMRLHVKNGRIIKITGTGDITTAKEKANHAKLVKPGGTIAEMCGFVPGVYGQSEAADESLGPIQRRPCVKALAEAKHIYGMDRLKYPMKQTKNRGDRSGFVRITWDEAYNTIVTWLNEMVERAKTLGYLPMWASGGPAARLGNYISTFGSNSTGGVNDGYWPCWGFRDVNYNQTTTDMLNSSFILHWSADPVSNRNHMPFYLIKAREMGIPIVDINSKHTLSSGSIPSGVAVQGIPAHITVNAGTDTAMQAAMAYVIYKNDKHDKTFIDKQTFGFHPAADAAHPDGVRTLGKAWTKDNAGTRSGINFAKGDTVSVPAGESFVEYLISLEKDWGGDAAAAWDTSVPRGANNPVGGAVYNKVLARASEISGVNAGVIEKLALYYANPAPVKSNRAVSYIFSPFCGGASRAQNGMYHTWMLLALNAMCGHLQYRGGGSGDVRFDDGYVLGIPNSNPASVTPNSGVSGKTIRVLKWQFGDVVLKNRDFRTFEELNADVKAETGIDLKNKGVVVEMLYRGGGHSASWQQAPDLTRNMYLFRDKSIIKHIVVYEQHLNTEASIADIVLPASFNLEDGPSLTQNRHSDMCVIQGGGIKPLYESKPDWLIDQELNIKLGWESSRYGGLTSEEALAARLDGDLTLPDSFSALVPGQEVPSKEKLLEEGNIQLVAPLEQSMMRILTYLDKPGTFPSETGYIQFWSPYLAARKRAILDLYGPRHAPMEEGYELLMKYTVDIGVPAGTPGYGMPGMKTKNGKQYTYSLQLQTPHEIQRAHSNYDNLPVIKDIFPHCACMHPSTAGIRGIKDGDLVYVYNDNGCLRIPAKLTNRVRPHMVSIGQGAWWRESRNPDGSIETYEAWYRDGAVRHVGSDASGGDTSVAPVMRKVPVDVGGAVNSLITGRPAGTADPFVSDSVALPTVGTLIEVSRVHPDTLA